MCFWEWVCICVHIERRGRATSGSLSPKPQAGPGKRCSLTTSWAFRLMGPNLPCTKLSSPKPHSELHDHTKPKSSSSPLLLELLHVNDRKANIQTELRLNSASRNAKRPEPETPPKPPYIHLVAELLRFQLFGINMIPYRTESVHFFMLMNSATRRGLNKAP